MKSYLRKILLAEDEASSAHLLASMLKKWGYEVVICKNGREALEQLQLPGAPQLAILDWMMPELSGPEVVQNIRESLQSHPFHFILLTSRSGSEDIVAAMQAGADDYLIKPVDFEQLRARLLIGFKSLETQRHLEIERQNVLRSSHLVSLGIMAGGVAHEVNNPLAIMLGHIQRIQADFRSDQVQKEREIERLEKISQGAQRISKVVKNLLMFAQDGDATDYEFSPVHNLFQDASVLCQPQIEKDNIRFTIDPIPESLVIECQKPLLIQAFFHLIHNALEASESSADRWVRIASMAHDGWIEVHVIDGGAGVPEQEVDHILEPFFTTKAVGRGSGMGLSVTNSIIEAHGGVLSYERESDATHFVVRLPLKQKKKLSHKKAA